MMQSPVLEVQNLTKRYGKNLAVACIGIAAIIFLATFYSAKKRGYLIHFSTESF